MTQRRLIPHGSLRWFDKAPSGKDPRWVLQQLHTDLDTSERVWVDVPFVSSPDKPIRRT